MARKKKIKHSKYPSFKGHYCKICDTYKANEKFSGKGYNAHICKSCASKSPAEKAESLILCKLDRMALRYINKAEVNWLRKRMNDSNTEISNLAKEIHNMKFPNYERNEIKKALVITDLEFHVCGNVYNEFGDEHCVNVDFKADTSGKIKRKVYDESNEVINEQLITIGQADIRKLFRVIVNNYNIYFWDKDLCEEVVIDDFDYVDYLELFDEEYDSVDEEEQLVEISESEDDKDGENRQPTWIVNVKYKNGIVQETNGYEELPDEVIELFNEFDEYFEEEFNQFIHMK